MALRVPQAKLRAGCHAHRAAQGKGCHDDAHHHPAGHSAKQATGQATTMQLLLK
jgi:hypothetical protein